MGEVLRAAARLAAAAALALAASGAAAQTVVRLTFETKANPPRYFGEGTAIDAARPGLTIELLRLAEARAGVRFELSRHPWARSIYLMETNQVDGLFHASYVADRERFAVYPMRDGKPDPSRSLFTQSYYLYARSGTPPAWNGETLTASGPVGTTRGYSVARRLESLGVRVVEENDVPNSLRKVLAGRLAAYAELENMAAAVIAAHPEELRDIVKLSPPLRTEPYYLVFSRGFAAREPRLAERIWGAIQETMRSPEYRALLAKYGLGA